MFKTNPEGLFVDATTDGLVAVFVDSFVSAMGDGPQEDFIIFRLYKKGEKSVQNPVPQAQIHQFVMPATRAAELGRHLLELAAQAEKEQSHPQAH